MTDTFTLAVDQKIRINLTLKPGAVTETLEVTAQAVNLDTDTAALSQEMSGEQVAALPLNGRNFMQLLLVGAGAVTVGGEQGTMRQGEGNAVSINGGRPEGNNYTLDGLVNTDQALVDSGGDSFPGRDRGIQGAERHLPRREWIRRQPGQHRQQGRNQLDPRGDFESNRNNAFDTSPFPTATDVIAGVKTANPILHLNQFGFVASGPVYIPKLYNGRNKTFWMANYEGWRMNNGQRVQTISTHPGGIGGRFFADDLSGREPASRAVRCLPMEPPPARQC